MFRISVRANPRIKVGRRGIHQEIDGAGISRSFGRTAPAEQKLCAAQQRANRNAQKSRA
jgi:hypothetical protein